MLKILVILQIDTNVVSEIFSSMDVHIEPNQIVDCLQLGKFKSNHSLFLSNYSVQLMPQQSLQTYLIVIPHNYLLSQLCHHLSR